MSWSTLLVFSPPTVSNPSAPAFHPPPSYFQGYKKSAWGQDELHPLSGTSGSWFDLGLTLVDSLDTLFLMGLEEEYASGREWVAHSLR